MDDSEILRREMEYLYSALHSILVISPYDAAYEIANSACNAYQQNREREKAAKETNKLKTMGLARTT